MSMIAGLISQQEYKTTLAYLNPVIIESLTKLHTTIETAARARPTATVVAALQARGKIYNRRQMYTEAFGDYSRLTELASRGHGRCGHWQCHLSQHGALNHHGRPGARARRTGF